MATLRIGEMVADAGDGPFLLISGLTAEAPAPADSAVLRIAELHADRGSGSAATVRMSALSATATGLPSTTPSPSGIALLSGGSWLPQIIRAGNGAGEWS